MGYFFIGAMIPVAVVGFLVWDFLFNTPLEEQIFSVLKIIGSLLAWAVAIGAIWGAWQANWLGKIVAIIGAYLVYKFML